MHDPVYAVLRDDGGFLTMDQILRRLSVPLDVSAFERHLAHLRRDFHIEVESRKSGDAYKLARSRRSPARTITSATRPSCAPPRSANVLPTSSRGSSTSAPTGTYPAPRVARRERLLPGATWAKTGVPGGQQPQRRRRERTAEPAPAGVRLDLEGHLPPANQAPAEHEAARAVARLPRPYVVAVAVGAYTRGCASPLSGRRPREPPPPCAHAASTASTVPMPAPRRTGERGQEPGAERRTIITGPAEGVHPFGLDRRDDVEVRGERHHRGECLARVFAEYLDLPVLRGQVPPAASSSTAARDTRPSSHCGR